MSSFKLNHLYIYDVSATTRHDIINSVSSFKCSHGVFPTVGSATLEMFSPVLNTSDAEVTLAKGDIVWVSYYDSSSSAEWVPFAGEITDITTSGERLIVECESLVGRLLRMPYTADYVSAEYVYEIVTDIETAFDSTVPYPTGTNYGIFRPTTGGSQVPINAQVSGVSFDAHDTGAIFQYFCELLANTGYSGVPGTVFGRFFTDGGTGLPYLTIEYTGFGNHRATAYEISHDNGGLLSLVNWADATGSVINDVTVTVKGGDTYNTTDATSISTYGQRQTKLLRPIYTVIASGQKHADTLLAHMKDPQLRCSVLASMEYIAFQTSETVTPLNWVYTVTDGVTGDSEEMVLREYEISYPSDFIQCEFDNAALNVSNYGMYLENRVSTLESNLVTAHSQFYDLQGGTTDEYYHLTQSAYNNLYQQDQTVKTTSSPTFSALTTTGDVSVGDELRISTDTEGVIKARDILRFKDSDSASEAQYIDLVSATHYINGTTQHTSAGLFLTRGADSTGWRTDIWFRPYGTVTTTNPTWRIGHTNLSVNDHDLHFQHYDGSTYTTLLELNADKTLTIGGNVGMGTKTLTCGAITSGGAAVTNSSGYVDQPKNIMVTASGSSGTSLSTTTWGKIDLSTEEYDTNSTFASDRFTAPVAGKYLVAYQCGIASLAADKTFYVDIVKNCSGGNYTTSGTRVIRAQSVSGGTHTVGATKILVLAASDYLEMWAYHNDSSSRNTASDSTSTFMSVHYLGA